MGQLPVSDWVDLAAQQLAGKVEKVPLPGSEDPAYQQWANMHGINTQANDYDTYQAFRAGLQPDARGHLDDTYKLPNHPTFSAESIHSNEQTPGGNWVQTLPPSPEMPEGTWTFQASPYNLKNRTKDQLKEYFDGYEPGSSIVFPDGETHLGKAR